MQGHRLCHTGTAPLHRERSRQRSHSSVCMCLGGVKDDLSVQLAQGTEMFINNLTVVWKLLCRRLLAAGGWVCPAAPTKVDSFNCETSRCAQRGGGFSVADVAGDGQQLCSGAGLVGEVAWALLGKKVGKRIAVVLSGLRAFINADFQGSHILGKNKCSGFCKTGTDRSW